MWSIDSQEKQFGIYSPSITPNKLTTSSGVVKYEIGQWMHTDSSGNEWRGGPPVPGIKMGRGMSKGTVLVQLIDTRKLKVEVFLGMAPDQVTGFSANAKMLGRGDNSKMIESNTAY